MHSHQMTPKSVLVIGFFHETLNLERWNPRTWVNYLIGTFMPVNRGMFELEW